MPAPLPSQNSEQAARASLPQLIDHSASNQAKVFFRKIRVEYEAAGKRHPCPLKWMDSFSMRNFTNAPVFDDTLPVADGLMQIGARVPLAELKTSMEDWFHRKGYLPKEVPIFISETRAAEE